VQTLAIVLGTLSGLRFVAPELEPPVTVATAVAMHVTYAILCRSLAVQRGRTPGAWLTGGFLLGVLAALVLLWIGEREAPAAS